MTVVIGPGGENKGRFEDLSSASDVKAYLKSILKYSGNTSKKNKLLSHYSNIECVLNIVEGGYLWLGSMSKMNDNLEYEVVRDLPYKLFFISFSKMSENIAMYRMYSQAPNGIILEISYMDAEDLVNDIPKDESGKCILNVVRDKKVTEETVKADVYWAAVCYKELHSNRIKTGSVTNSKIKEPMLEDELAGFIKLDGWEFEKEVRLCAVTDDRVDDNICLAIKLPEAFSTKITAIKCPDFNKEKYNSEIRKLKKYGVTVRESEYESIVTLDKTATISNDNAQSTDSFDHIVERAEIVVLGDSLDSYGKCDSNIGKYYLSIMKHLNNRRIAYSRDEGDEKTGNSCLVVNGIKIEYLKSLPIINDKTLKSNVTALRISIATRSFSRSMSLLIDILRLYKEIDTNRILLHLSSKYSFVKSTEEASAIICDHDDFDVDNKHLDTYLHIGSGLRFSIKEDNSRKRMVKLWGGIVTVDFNNKSVKPDSIVMLMKRLIEIGLIYCI